MNTIQKIDDDHWIVDEDYHIRYSNDFGFSGWYWDINPNQMFPDTKPSFLEVLEEVIGEIHSPKKLPPLAGM